MSRHLFWWPAARDDTRGISELRERERESQQAGCWISKDISSNHDSPVYLFANTASANKFFPDFSHFFSLFFNV